MTSSRSKASTSNGSGRSGRFGPLGLLLVLGVVVAAWLVSPTLAYAEKKRVVVLEFEGPNAAKFQKDVIRLIKKSHTVVPTDKWLGTADKLGISGVTEKNVKKIAAKLRIDAVVQGKIEKRRNSYLIHLKLRAGKSGALVGSQVDTKADGAKIEGKAAKEIKSELVDAIADISSAKPVRGGGDDEEEAEEEVEDEPVAKGKKGKGGKKGDEEAEDEPVAKGKKGKKGKNDDEADPEEEEAEPKGKKGFSRRDEDAMAQDKIGGKPGKKGKGKAPVEDEPVEDQEVDEDATPAPKKVATGDDEEEEAGDEEGASVKADTSVGATVAEPLSPGERAVDLLAGLSFTRRTLSWNVSGDLTDKPPPYTGKYPVAGVLIDGTVYPLAFGHKRRGMLKNFGLTFMYDRVLVLSSQDKATGMKLSSSESRYAVGLAFRYPLGPSAVVGLSARYGAQSFSISGNTGLPNVKYSIIDPMLFFRYSLSRNLVLGANVGYMLVRGTGAMGTEANYGSGSQSGLEAELGFGYRLTNSLFAHAAFRFNRISMKFNGTGMQTTMRDADTEQDVFGATDMYLGGAVTVGYAY